MANKKYYWLKLKENFFTDKTIKKLRKIAGGDTYTIIYLKLLLKATETDGKLYFDGVEDTFADEIALDIDEDSENVKVTLMYLIKNRLLVEISDYEMELTRINEMIGSETNKAELMRKKRARDKQLHEQEVTMLPDVTKKVTMLPDVTKTLPYIEIEKDIDKELEKDIEKKKREKKKTMDSSESSSSSSSSKKTKKVVKHKYGEYDNVLLSDEELDKLKRDFPTDYQDRIDRLSEYVASTGKTYKNYLATIRAWARKEKQEQTYKQPQQQEEKPKNWWEKTI